MATETHKHCPHFSGWPEPGAVTETACDAMPIQIEGVCCECDESEGDAHDN